MAKASKKEIAKRFGKVLLNVGTAIAAKKGLDKLSEQDFMQGEAGKFPVKKAGANGAAFAAGVAGAVLMKNEYVQEIGKGLAVAGGLGVTDNVLDAVGTEGTEGMGDAADKYLSMYDNLSGEEEETTPEMSGEEKVPLEGVEGNEVPLEGNLEENFAGDDNDYSNF